LSQCPSIRCQGRRALAEGQKAEFVVVIGEKGEQAHDVEVPGRCSAWLGGLATVHDCARPPMGMSA